MNRHAIHIAYGGYQPVLSCPKVQAEILHPVLNAVSAVFSDYLVLPNRFLSLPSWPLAGLTEGCSTSTGAG